MFNVRRMIRVIAWIFLSMYLVGEYGLQGLRPKNFNLSADK